MRVLGMVVVAVVVYGLLIATVGYAIFFVYQLS